jgi:hypothetical protein
MSYADIIFFRDLVLYKIQGIAGLNASYGQWADNGAKKSA